RELERDLAVRRSAAGLDSEPPAEMAKQLFAAAQLAREATANPQPRLAERGVLLVEELVEGHRVVDLSRTEVEQLGDLLDRLARDAAQRVVDQVQRGERDGLLAGVARQVGEDLLPQLLGESCHSLPPRRGPQGPRVITRGPCGPRRAVSP